MIYRGRDLNGGYYTGGADKQSIRYYYEIGNAKSRENAKKKANISSAPRSKKKIDDKSYRKKIVYRRTLS